MARMKIGKATRPDGIQIEAWKCLRFFNKTIRTKKMLNEWKVF